MAFPATSQTPTRPRKLLCGALADCSNREGSRRAGGRLRQKRAFVYVKPARDAASGTPRRRRFESQRDRLYQGRPPVLSEKAARRATARFCRHRQQRPGRHRSRLRQQYQRCARQAALPDRRARPRLQPSRASADGRARPSSSRSTSTCSTSPSASCATPSRHNRAAGGTVSSWSAEHGEILALANEPTFNPNAFSSASPEHRRNRAVQDIYEPGSTFKVVTASAAIEEQRHRRRRHHRRRRVERSASDRASSTTRTTTDRSRSPTSW